MGQPLGDFYFRDIHEPGPEHLTNDVQPVQPGTKSQAGVSLMVAPSVLPPLADVEGGAVRPEKDVDVRVR